MRDLINRNEIRRLEKAARDKDKSKLYEWLERYTDMVDNCLRQDYEKQYQDEIQTTMDNMLIAIMYTLYYSEENYIDKTNIADFMADLFSSFDMYRTGEYKPKEFRDDLKSVGIETDFHDLDKIYKQYLNRFDSDLVKYLKSERRKIVMMCGSSKFKNEILEQQKLLTLDGYMVLTDGVFEHSDNINIQSDERLLLNKIHEEKLLISDTIFVINKDNYIGDGTKNDIEFAKKHNKKIMYLESPSNSNEVKK